MEFRSQIIYFVLIFYTSIIAGNHWRCDYTYVRNAHGYFKYHRIPATWRDARLQCQLEGAVLASPYPQIVRDALLELITDQDKNDTIFTGIHATFSKRNYHTIDGTPLSQISINWMKSEPDNKNNAESCIILTPTGLAADTKCGDTHPYFCYKKKKDDDVFMVSCGIADREYEYNAATGSCYKFHTVPRTWSRAHMACSAEGGHLLIVNSKEEKDFIYSLFGKHPKTTIIGTEWPDHAFVGVHDWDEHSDWRTIHGESLKEAGYDIFASYEPSNRTTGEFCGKIYRYYGELGAMWCGEHLAFICEKKPNSLVCDDDDDEF